jgi:coatomer protein complex subunit gamma
VVKANALRVLTKIIDEQYVQTLEKFIKQALNDKSSHVVSSALVSLIDLWKKGGPSQVDLVRKSIVELNDKLMNSKDGFVQYQALVILFELKKNDPMSCLKLLY